ncbi:MAG: hypothetical protein M1816_002404 [Peltula sp. TS41687]|nr:MAG: hypothetical protein M1816_002404 [Peltula sp. TS41687]
MIQSLTYVWEELLDEHAAHNPEDYGVALRAQASSVAIPRIAHEWTMYNLHVSSKCQPEASTVDYEAVNRKVSRQLYELIGGETDFDAETKRHWEAVAATGVKKALEELKK